MLKKAPSLKPGETALLLFEQYETKFGIYNHTSQLIDRPLALVALQPNEDGTTNGRLAERMELFLENQVYKRFGVSWTEFTQMPHDDCEQMLEIAIRQQKAESILAGQITAQMGGG